MQTEWIIAILAAVCVVFFLLTKKNKNLPGKKIGAGYDQDAKAANDFRHELETVAEMAVKKIEEKIFRLDYLIEEAQEKSNQLDLKIKLVNNIIGQIKEGRGDFHLPGQKQNNKSQFKKEQMAALPKGKMAQLAPIGFTEAIHTKNTGSIFAAKKTNAAEKEILNNEKHRVALTMLQEGYNVLDIAKVTGLGKGEIMLLQGLRERKN